MSTLVEIEAAILELPPTEKSQLVEWLDEHRDEIAPVTDAVTAQRLERLAKRWEVSQEGVVRRSVEQAEKLTKAEQADPAAMLRELFASGGGMDPERGSAYIAEVYEDRKRWRGE